MLDRMSRYNNLWFMEFCFDVLWFLHFPQVHDEVVQAIKDSEEGLFRLKRARLIREADSVLLGSNNSTDDVKVEPIDPADVKPEPLEEQSYSVGSRCRFRYTNGRWYSGRIVELDGSESAKISFLTPTSENMLVCAIFLLSVSLQGHVKLYISLLIQ